MTVLQRLEDSQEGVGKELSAWSLQDDGNWPRGWPGAG
jgi:hypothetical protein